MNSDERRLITELFARLRSAEAEPRDPDVERLIADELRIAPNAVYAMAQTIIAQNEASSVAARRLPAPEMGGTAFNRRGSVPSFGRGTPEARGGFLATAGQVALGVAGGVLMADAARALFTGTPEAEATGAQSAADTALSQHAGAGDIAAGGIPDAEPGSGGGFFDWLFGRDDLQQDFGAEGELASSDSGWDDGGGEWG